jgi:hypothetical protein
MMMIREDWQWTRGASRAHCPKGRKLTSGPGVESRGTGRPLPLETKWPLAISLPGSPRQEASWPEAACYGLKIRRGPDRAPCRVTDSATLKLESLLASGSLGTSGLYPC